MRRTAIGTVIVSLALGSFAAALGEPPRPDPARGPIERAGKAFSAAFARGDIAAVARIYAEDAIAFPPDSDMLKGRAAIETFWRGTRDTGVRAVDLNVVDVTSSGNLAAETGIAVLHIQAVGPAQATVQVKYVVVWKKTGGAWKISRDIWNSMPAAAAPAATKTSP